MMFLELKGDGTFRLPYYQRNLAGDVKDKSLYEGEYHLDDYILKILQFPALTLCNSANGGKALIFRRFRHLPFGRVIRICRRFPA